MCKVKNKTTKKTKREQKQNRNIKDEAPLVLVDLAELLPVGFTGMITPVFLHLSDHHDLWSLGN